MLFSSLLRVKSSPAPTLNRSIAKQIQRLLLKSHQPRVRVERSTIPGAGSGVYAQEMLYEDDVACLYPGVYTPPLPNTRVAAGMECVYLADQRTPSGVLAEENAYILNLTGGRAGGYLDGRAFDDGQALMKDEEAPTRKDEVVARFNDNPSACGHFVNHNASKANISVLSFLWQDVFRLLPSELVDQNEKESRKYESLRYEIPNRTRMDGSPWYFDPLDQQIIYFQHRDDEESRSSACGAAMVVLESIDESDELFLDYGLQQPYPDWAKDWYSNSK